MITIISSGDRITSRLCRILSETGAMYEVLTPDNDLVDEYDLRSFPVAIKDDGSLAYESELRDYIARYEEYEENLRRGRVI
jgi:hypothetical protein